MNFVIKKGFTLIELLVVISIIAVLSVVGITVFGGIQKNARDAKRKADVGSIIKAYEVRYNSSGSYGNTIVEGTAFSSGSLPTPPEGGSYDVILDNDTGGIKACATLEGSTDFCKGSTQEQPPTDSSDVTYLSGTPPPPPLPDNQNLWFGDITYYSTNDCNNLMLWVCDKDYPQGPITVNIYNGPKASNNLVATGQTSFTWGGTNVPSVCGATAQKTGFSLATPASLKDGQTHTLYYYGMSLNTSGQPGSRGEVGGSSEPFKCPR